MTLLDTPPALNGRDSGGRRGLTIDRVSPHADPYHGVEWERGDAMIGTDPGTAAFHQRDVETPSTWSQTARNIVAQKYFRGAVGEPGREDSVRQLIDRVAGTITRWGHEDGYFAADADRDAFDASLRWLLVDQRASFNSPVWFNIGVDGVAQQASACFILDVEDTLASILNWITEEGTIFKGGSGAGVNLSKVRAAGEPLDGGGHASGPTSFMRGADASAGTIRSGGKTRRAAKMVLLDDDHPDIEAFVTCKAREESKARALAGAGFDMNFDAPDAASLSFQNANHSVRLSDEFMATAERGERWRLRGRVADSVDRDVDAADLLGKIAQAAWECGDPGVQFSSTITRWHTIPNAGPIEASNPCSEYLSISNSACNLASLNVVKFLGPDDRFDVAGFVAAAQIMLIAQDILVDRASYPTPKIGDNTRRFRQLGLGITNLGAALMRRGCAYESPAGVTFGGAVCSLLGGAAYAMSARMAAALGPFEGFASDRDATVGVLGSHRDAAETLVARIAEGIDGVDGVCAQIAAAGLQQWRSACSMAHVVGVRNAQTTVLAPTGTISFKMDCDTTGVEPDVALVKHKRLAGGGSITIVNESVRPALERLGYAKDHIDRICDHLRAGGRIADPEADVAVADRSVFACALGDVHAGDTVVSPHGHVAMMAACQPFISGAISKTVNLPSDTTPTDIVDLYRLAHRSNLKALAVFRDGCKASQPVTAAAPAAVDEADEAAPASREREHLPRERTARTFAFKVADCQCYMTVGEFDDGRPGEIFLKVSKQGSTLAGITDALAMSVSLGLQWGVPASAFVGAFTGMRFEPAGMTDDPEIFSATSLLDFLGRKLALSYLHPDERAGLGIVSKTERSQTALPGLGGDPFSGTQPDSVRIGGDAPLCVPCGVAMRRVGACWGCESCGTTSGCG